MGKALGVPCPKCTYRALSLSDLEAHGRDTHTPEPEEGEERAAATFVPLVAHPQPVGAAVGLEQASPESQHPSLAVPDPDPTFYVDEQVTRFLHAVWERSQKADIVNVLLIGPTGSGKSSLPKEVAAMWRRPFFTMHCQLITEQGDWWGNREVSPQTGTYFRKELLVDAVETPGCIILLDEANRTHPENLNALFGLLDHRRCAWIPGFSREVVVAPGVVFFITLNEGVDYVGTNAVDRALRDRVSNTIRMDYLPQKVEVEVLVKRMRIDERTAWKLVEFAHAVRRNPKTDLSVSTRQLLECAALVKEGLPLRDAVLFSVANGALEDGHRKALLQSLQVMGAVGEAYVPGRFDDDE